MPRASCLLSSAAASFLFLLRVGGSCCRAQARSWVGQKEKGHRQNGNLSQSAIDVSCQSQGKERAASSPSLLEAGVVIVGDRSR